MRSTPISYALALAAALSVSTAGTAMAQNRGTPAPPPVPQFSPPVPGAGQVRTAPPQSPVTPTRTPTPQTSSPAGLPVPGAGSITVADGNGASPASPGTYATPNNDWIQQLIALQYSSMLYNSLSSAANQLPPGADPNVVASQMASAQQTAVANWFNNGAEATSVPAADSKAGAYFSNGASVMSVPTDQGQNSWFTNGASVTSVPSGNQRGASYFSNGGQATSVPNSVPPLVPAPAPTQNQSAIPEAGVSTAPAVDLNEAPVAPDEAVSPTDQSGAPVPAAAPIDTSTTTTGAVVPSGEEGANDESPGTMQNAVIATAVVTTPNAGEAPSSPPTNVASGSMSNVAPAVRGSMFDESRGPPSSDSVQRPFMGFRILVAFFGLAVMTALVVGRLVARRSRQRGETARSLM